ncbi:hypothetical protein TRFO_06357 [Tritrichomonas foetus]|uniref:HEAT repeat family protein n=1 Tax=Tritrichomonas foetus TaxID=1144522 RepID=A0A1J4K3X2_9EUKA|nr:hypothetical protein TRFO_06357 [Tritrichomonas foetus]|eukprot:OHT04452.1 hypothetical protein TRFO_06357 [Tritrichomonas foetus]
MISVFAKNHLSIMEKVTKMSTANSVFELFDLAISSEESHQLEFVNHIPDILTTFEKDWLRTNFLPFLVTWLPNNNIKIVKALLPFIPQIASSVGGLEDISPLVESILSSDNPEIRKSLAPLLTKIHHDPTSKAFLSNLTKSSYDCVRAFVPSIITLVGNENYQRDLVGPLVYDVSFKVRFATAKLIKSLKSQTLAYQIALTLTDDLHAQIRAVIPVASAKRSFLITHITPKLMADHDWSVRASVAQQLVHCKEHKEALKHCVTLAGDGVWQVKLCALRSIATISAKVKEVPKGKKLIPILIDIIKFPQQSLKKIVIDTFLALHSKIKSSISTASIVNDVILQQPPQVKLHFLTQIVNQKQTKLVKLIKPKLLELIDSLSHNDQWRVRLGAVSLLTGLNIDDQLLHQLSDLCLSMIDDEAAPVREAASVQLAQFILPSSENGSVPSVVKKLIKSDTFRKRQAAILIMKTLIEKSKGDAVRETLLPHIQKLTKDPCSNVVTYAQAALKTL